MIAQMSKQIANLFVARKVVPADEVEIYAYGAELILSDVVNFCMILTLGAIFQRFTAGVIFLVCFVPTRRFCGGYHASTHGRCRGAMIFTFIILLVVTALFPPQRFSLIMLMNLASCCVIFILAPIENQNKPLSEGGRRRNRARARFTAVLLSLLSTILCIYGSTAGVVICVTLFIIATLMIIEHQKRKGEI